MSRKFLSFLVENIYNFFDLFHTWRLRKFYSKKDFDLVIDVGSHKVEFINRVINKRIPIYSFESQKEVSKHLKKNTLKNNVDEYYEYAVLNYDGYIDFHINNMSSKRTIKKTNSSSI